MALDCEIYITYCLLLLLTRVNLKVKKSMLEIQQLLKETMFKPFDDFLEILNICFLFLGIDF
ncbi:MAG: hypothetical protein VR69_02765 [Peptococcaceae bacterium BRH_c4b]|nr:MAG: hypothetical protein VR69_02765 [Peptococcaceae bacterium BRH_c4b]